MAEEQWYTNKDLYGMVQDLKQDISTLKLELAETTTLIRDYNGLRQKINDCERALFENHGKETGGKNVWGYIVGAIGIASFVLSLAMK